MTARDLIRGSLRLIGAIASGESGSENEQAEALAVLNDLMDSWSLDGFLLYQTKRESFPITTGLQNITMGPLGTFDTIRPIKVLRASVEQNGNEIPIRLVTVDEWAKITVKSTNSELPSKIYVEGTFPLETLNIWPIPSAANNLIIYSYKPLLSFVNDSDDLILPPGYARALRYNLAIELASEYGKTIPQEVALIATESKTYVQRQNTKPVYMISDALGLPSGGTKTFNWITGE